jgi:hypothetical protein
MKKSLIIAMALATTTAFAQPAKMPEPKAPVKEIKKQAEVKKTEAPKKDLGVKPTPKKKAETKPAEPVKK